MRREVFEESAIKVGPVRYVSAQPWPFPMSLMFGCYGEATSDAITIDPVELEDARWVSRDEVKQILAGTHAEISKPPHQHSAATTPALRGPARSSQLPHSAALEPSKTKNKVYIQPSVEIGQSQRVLDSCAQKPTSGPQVMALSMPSALDSGNQNTEKP